MATITGMSGMISGYDIPTTVNGLLGPKQAEIDNLGRKKDVETQRQDAYAQLNSLLSDLRNTSLAMKDSASFFSYTASLSSSNASVPASSLLDVAGDASVTSGNHTIVVNALAQEQRLSSSAAVKDSTGTAITSNTSALGLTGSFQINGTTINVVASNSLNDIASAINAENATTGVTASVIKVADGDYRLIMAADATGATGFTLSGAALDAAGTLANLNMGAVGQTNAQQELQPPQDASMTIDGLTITRSSNTITDAIAGLTFNLKQKDVATTVTMSIGVDSGAVQSQVQSFMDSYNALSTFINDQFKFDATTGQNGILAREGLLTNIQSVMSSTVLTAVPGLASDRDSLVKVGIEPDSSGKLQFNDALFSKFLNSDATAIRDVFVASGSSDNLDLQFLVPGLNSPSGSYAVNITTAAARASVVGTTDLSTGLAGNETVTLTESGNGRQAVVNLLAGQTQAQVINALNTEFTTEYTEQHQASAALTDTGTASAATGSTTLSALGLGVTAGDTITISGTSRTGSVVTGTFSVLNPATDKLSDLLSSIQSTFGQSVVASIDPTGKVTVTDSQAGDSRLTVSLTANNEGGGTLNFGTDTLVTEGRYAMSLEAVTSGNMVEIRQKNYGASSGFTLAQSANNLGLVDGAYAGVDVAGTINGLAATGAGQMLTGKSGNVEAMSVLYAGATTGSIGTITLGMGIAALYEGTLDMFSNPFSGLVQNTIQASNDTNTTIQKRIDDLTAQLEIQRVSLTQAFTKMEQSMNASQSSGSFLTNQFSAMYARKY